MHLLITCYDFAFSVRTYFVFSPFLIAHPGREFGLSSHNCHQMAFEFCHFLVDEISKVNDTSVGEESSQTCEVLNTLFSQRRLLGPSSEQAVDDSYVILDDIIQR